MSVNLPLFSQVVERLYELQCCARCVLRYLGVQGASLYSKPYQEIVNHVHADYGHLPSTENESSGDEAICIACLGLLQPHSTSTLVKQICDAVKSSEHEYFNFTTSIFSPPVLTFRHANTLKYDSHSCYSEEVAHENILRLKECLKFVWGPQMEHVLDVEFNKKSPFTISITLDHPNAMKELEFLTNTKRVFKCHPRKRKKVSQNEPTVTSTQLTNCIQTLKTSEEFNEVGKCPPGIVKTYCELTKVECSNASVFLAGRYNKYSRTLSQSPWIVNGERMTEHSVEELVAEEIKKVFQPNDSKFSSAGREDVDVQMLGNGRPFILELINPRRVVQTLEQVKELQTKVNASTEEIQIRDLQMITREDCSKLKEGENSKTKTYKALVYVPEGFTEEELKPLLNLKDVTLDQKTPLRVLHRRPLAVRRRRILSMFGEYIDDKHFTLQLRTEAGTYIKEFVHGDFGRTQPNLSTIMNKETDILELDVMSVDVDWPPCIDT